MLIQLPVRLLLVAEKRLSRVTSPTMASTTPRMSIRRSGGMPSNTEKRSGGTVFFVDLRDLRGRMETLTGSNSGSGRPRFPEREEGLPKGFFERVMGMVSSL